MTIFLRCLLLALVISYAPPRASAATDEGIPQVRFALFRLDFLTYQVKGVCEFSQPLRKSLPAPGFQEDGNIHWQLVPAGDFGFTEINSRLTGERVLRAATVWSGRGGFEYPPETQFEPLVGFGFQNPDPDDIVVRQWFSANVDPMAAWRRVSDSDVIHRLSSFGSYEVFVADHFYTVGISDPTTAEWFVIAFTRPPAPDDMAFVDMRWPKTLVTRGSETTPEIVVHNFGDAPVDAGVELTITSSAQNYHRERVELRAMAPDESRTVTFESVADMGLDTFVMGFRFVDGSGLPWEDAYPDNDAWDQAIDVIGQPVFRSSERIRVTGVPCDLDGDGDLDVLSLGYELSIWRNDGHASFTDISDRSPSSFPWARDAVAGDFNHDGATDFLVLYWGTAPQLYLGDGTGSFIDGTADAGLGSIRAFGQAALLDKENDGDVDIIFPTDGQETVVENNGSGFFTDVTSASGIVDANRTQQIAVGDLNDDGFSDVILTNWGADAQVFINQKDGTFARLSANWGLQYARGSHAFDYDGDGDTDILFYRDANWGESLMYENLGGLMFRDVSASAGPIPGVFQMGAGDVNGDGTTDLVLSDGMLLLNLDGRFVDYTALLVGVESSPSLGQARIADIDEDGDMDILAARVFENQFEQPPTTKPIDSPDTPPAVEAQLEQNVPNPFNPQTAIAYTIAQPSRVTLRIYNVAGQLVRTLVDEFQSPRPEGHSVIWNGLNDAGRQVGSGVYYYQLRTNGTIFARKMVVIR